MQTKRPLPGHFQSPQQKRWLARSALGSYRFNHPGLLSESSSRPNSLPVFRLTRCILVQAGQAIASYSFSETSGSSSNRCWTLKPVAGHLKTKFVIIQHQLGRQRCKKKPRGRAGLVRWRSSLGGANTDQCKLQGGPSGFVISGSGYPPSFSKQALSRNLLDRSLIVFRVFGAI